MFDEFMKSISSQIEALQFLLLVNALAWAFAILIAAIYWIRIILS